MVERVVGLKREVLGQIGQADKCYEIGSVFR
jgi:hypothetical protein